MGNSSLQNERRLFGIRREGSVRPGRCRKGRQASPASERATSRADTPSRAPRLRLTEARVHRETRACRTNGDVSGLGRSDPPNQNPATGDGRPTPRTSTQRGRAAARSQMSRHKLAETIFLRKQKFVKRPETFRDSVGRICQIRTSPLGLAGQTHEQRRFGTRQNGPASPRRRHKGRHDSPRTGPADAQRAAQTHATACLSTGWQKP